MSKMTYVVVLFLAVICSILQDTHCGPTNTDPVRVFLKEYDTKVCNNEPTCNLTNNPGLTTIRLTLEKRDCMCDFECIQYGDCCIDSQYFNSPSLENPSKEYICPSQFKVYMIQSCAPHYPNELIKQYCAKALQPLDDTDYYKIRPATNIKKRITYANLYCALCNNDTDVEPWNLTAGCGVAPAGYINPASTVNNPPENKISIPNTPSKSASSTVPPTVPNKNNNKNVQINLHFNPGAIFGNNKNANAGINEKFTLPSFGASTKILNKTIGSQTGIFGASIGRFKRQIKRENLELNFYEYASKTDEILKTVKYNPNVQELVGKYDGKDFICRVNASISPEMKSFSRTCVPNVIDQCPNDPKATKLCQSYTQLVYKKNQAYKNRDCAHCNGITDAELTGCPQEAREGAMGLFSFAAKGNPNSVACEVEDSKKFC